MIVDSYLRIMKCSYEVSQIFLQQMDLRFVEEQ